MSVTSESPSSLATRVVLALRAARFTWSSEADLQRDVGAVLTRARLAYKREKRFGPRDRADFVVGGGSWVVLELKLKQPASSIYRQLLRYAEHHAVTALVIASPHHCVLRLPSEALDKPLHRVQLMGW